jgi:hypothetical protein
MKQELVTKKDEEALTAVGITGPELQGPMTDAPQEPQMSEKQYVEMMKAAIKQLKLRHEYVKLESEIAIHEFNRVKALEAMAQMQAPVAPNAPVFPENDGEPMVGPYKGSPGEPVE